MPRNPNQIGALWTKTKGDKEYYSGVIEFDGKKTYITVFANDYKTLEKHPDYIILRQAQKGGEGNAEKAA